jgi:hypothetical protein
MAGNIAPRRASAALFQRESGRRKSYDDCGHACSRATLPLASVELKRGWPVEVHWEPPRASAVTKSGASEEGGMMVRIAESVNGSETAG